MRTTIRTTRCSQHDHPEFSLQYDAPPVIDVWINWMIGFLEDDVAAGARYYEGETLEIGWMRTSIGKHANGDLTVLEPDFMSMPINWTASVTQTLAHLFFQKYVAESIDVEMQFPSYLHTAIVCNRFGASDSFMLARVEPSAENDMDSGWFLGCTEPRHDHDNVGNLQVCSLYEAVLRDQEVIPFLALPTNVTVLRGATRKDVQIMLGEQTLPVIENSYLHHVLKA